MTPRLAPNRYLLDVETTVIVGFASLSSDRLVSSRFCVKASRLDYCLRMKGPRSAISSIQAVFSPDCGSSAAFGGRLTYVVLDVEPSP